ncbi:MAG: tRNA pseudouridine(38-40) synthase TruA [Flavobacteriales bacterium]|nr:tRNA pseudouridine(38-40) synthase TruA [Flavobacteriales bacterium]MDW8431251.1 tRNA pseudouridine(38-40) synthase TruA [Flavobacteriales bacterium]
MPRYFLRLMYEGGAFVGWQKQNNGLAVQEVLEKVLSLQVGCEVRPVAAGRTDSGVHARGMVVHVDFPQPLRVYEDFLHKLNSHLPKSICATALRASQPRAHARFDAYERRYTYRMCLWKNPFEWGRAWMLFSQPQTELMQEAARDFLGRHDFGAFCSRRSQEPNRICEVKRMEVEWDNGVILFRVHADRFLMNMVRTMVGTLVEIGLKRRPVDDIPRILASGDRRLAGVKAPAEGLYFMEALYPENIFLDDHWHSFVPGE